MENKSSSNPANEALKRLFQADQKARERISHAREEANRLKDEARREGEEQVEKAKKEARAEAEEIIAEVGVDDDTDGEKSSAGREDFDEWEQPGKENLEQAVQFLVNWVTARNTDDF